MVAETIFSDPADMNPAIAELIELDFDVEVLDWIDDDGPAVWILATTLSKLGDCAFFDWMNSIVEPLGGFVVEAGYAARPRNQDKRP